LSTSVPDKRDAWLEVVEWLRVAASDQRAARICLTADPPLRGVAAFHCQQAAEKPLKGLLVRAGADFSKTHDLDRLGHSVIAHFPSVTPLVATARAWTTWSVAYRYPGESGPEPEPSEKELEEALDLIAHLAAMLQSLEPPAIDGPRAI
jgi:HEPN domain-containing protein